MKNNSMISIDRNKVLSNDNLLGLRGGAKEEVHCCFYFEDGTQYGEGGWSVNGNCEYNFSLPDGVTVRECDPVQ